MLGAGLLWTSLIYVGAAYSIKLKKRVILIEKTLVFFEEVKILLEFLNMPIYEMLNEINKKTYLKDLNFIALCCEKMKNATDFPLAWKEAVEDTSLLYKTAEREKLLQLGENLGKSSKENQLIILNLHTLYFQEYLENAKNTSKRYGNMATAIGVLSGCMVFILLI